MASDEVGETGKGWPPYFMAYLPFPTLFSLVMLFTWWEVASLSMLCRFSPSLAFDSLITMCLGVNLFEFIWGGVYWTSWMCRLVFFITNFFVLFYQIGKFLAIISSNILSVLFFLLFSGTPVRCILIYYMVSHRSLRLCSYFFILFSFVFLG